MSIKRKLHHLVSGQIPEFVRIEYPQFVTFLEHYYRFLEQEGEAHDVLLNNADWNDIDVTLDAFVNYYRRQFTYDLPDNTIIDNRRLIKYINQYYEAKGSEKATEMFFRFMFNDTASVEYPGNYILKNSDGQWSRKRIIKVENTRFLDENIFELEGRVITLRYLESIEGAGDYERTLTTRCFAVYETSRPNIYQLEVDINPNFRFPDFVAADLELAPTLGNYDTHIYVQLEGVTYGTISKQLVSLAYIEAAGSRFQRDDSYFISEVGVEGDYFAADYTVILEGEGAYVYELLQNNAVIRVKEIRNALAEQYFLQDYTIFGDYASAPIRGQLHRLSIVDTGERFRARNFGQLETIDVIDGGSNYVQATTAVSIEGDGIGGLAIPIVVQAVSVGGLTNNVNYYVVKIDSNTIKLATTYANAIGTPVTIDLTSIGKGARHTFSGTETVTFSSATDVNITDNSITLPSHPFNTGDAVLYNNGGGTITQVVIEKSGSNYTSAVAVVTGAGIGAELKVNIAPRGEPVKQFSVDLTPGRQGGSPASLVFNTGEIYHAPGEYRDNSGFLSDIVKIQDNDYYQPYSYVIRTTKPLSKWKDLFLNSSHPSGFKMFAELKLEGTINNTIDITSEIEQILASSL